MKNNVLTIMKKEFARFFGDRRLLITLILPALLIYVLYSFMGTAMQDMFMPDADYVPVAYVFNMPDSLSGDAMGNWEWAMLIQPGADNVDGLEAAKRSIEAQEADLCIIFPQDFDARVEVYDVRNTSADPAPNIEIYYNSLNMDSYSAYVTVTFWLDRYESALSNKFDINAGISDADLATAQDASTDFISMIMPLMLMIFLFSGCTGIAPESIAGEKERGTIGALLVSPLKRSELAIGKILSLGVLAFLAGLVSAVATIVSLPKITSGVGMSTNIYSVGDYLYLALIILSTILLLVSIISIISAFAKTVKEATSTVMPLMIVVTLVGVTAMFGGAQTQTVYYLIPFYNSVQGMSAVFSLDYSPVNIIVATVSNLVYACAGGFILTKMFNSEKVMFSK